MGTQNQLQKATSAALSPCLRNCNKYEQLLPAFKLLNVAGARSFGEDELKLIILLVREEYPDMTMEQLTGVIKDGVKGKFNSEGNAPINSITLFRWLRDRPDKYRNVIGHHTYIPFGKTEPETHPVYEGRELPKSGYKAI